MASSCIGGKNEQGKQKIKEEKQQKKKFVFSLRPAVTIVFFISFLFHNSKPVFHLTVPSLKVWSICF